MAWDNTAFADAQTVATEASKVRGNWAAIEGGDATGGVPQKGSWVEAFNVGKGSDSDIYFYANNGDANKPFIKYDASSSEWQFSDDGSSTTTFTGVPSSSVILYVGTSCPTGYTDITATHEDRYIMADSLASAAVSTGGSNEGTTDGHIHTATDHTGDDGNSGTIQATGGSSTLVHTIASATDTVTIAPQYAGFRLCQKD